MKNWLINLPMIALASLLLWSCEKDETRAVVKDGSGLTLSASETALVLDANAVGDTIEAFSWTPADFGYDAAVSYTLQLATAGTNFLAPKEVKLGSGRGVQYTHGELNQIALVTLGLTAGELGQMEARVKGEISTRIDAVYSNVVPISIKPFVVVISYPSLWVPGAYQGWAPMVAPKVSSVMDNAIYEGYVNISGGNLEFKFTSNPDWDHTNYGLNASTVTGTSVTGTLNTVGNPPNLSVPVAGYYRLKANTNTLTWEATKTDWGLIGDAIAGTEWASDKDMTYDEATKTWSITLDLLAGKSIKFRANDAWTINYGDTGANSSLEPDGANITVPTDGNYTVTLDLSTPGAYTYKLKKN